MVSTKCTDKIIVSNPRSADVLHNGWASNHYSFNTGSHSVPIGSICTSIDGDKNCPIPTAYTCELRNQNCDEGTLPLLEFGMSPTPIISDGNIIFYTANGGKVRYCVVCKDGSNTCQDGNR
jgi:hypothetical protein